MCTVFSKSLHKIAVSCDLKVKELESFTIQLKMKYFPLALKHKLLAVKAQTFYLRVSPFAEIDDILLYAITS